jgi:hypothetical protein
MSTKDEGGLAPLMLGSDCTAIKFDQVGFFDSGRTLMCGLQRSLGIDESIALRLEISETPQSAA